MKRKWEFFYLGSCTNFSPQIIGDGRDQLVEGLSSLPNRVFAPNEVVLGYNRVLGTFVVNFKWSSRASVRKNCCTIPNRTTIHWKIESLLPCQNFGALTLSIS